MIFNNINAKIILTTSMLLLLILHVFSQNEANNWRFGRHVGLEFGSGEPVINYNVPFITARACASISDTSGVFLFSCNGRKVWNSNLQVMENGLDMLGDHGSGQGALILQKPGSDHSYYLFTVAHENRPQYGMRYSVIDMTLDGGLGAVTEEKNIPMDVDWHAVEKMTSVRHENGQDIWVIVRKYMEGEYASFLLTSSGVSTQPVISYAKEVVRQSMRGSMKISHDNKRLACAIQGESESNHLNQGVEICNFNASTGEVEFLYTLSKNGEVGHKAYEPWAVEFSPDSKLLYVSFFNELLSSDSMELYQYDMQYYEDSLQFFQSEIKIAVGPVDGLQLARDGKIYCTGFDYGPYNQLSVIHKPWVRGQGCDYESDALYIGEDMVADALPNILTDYLFRFEWDGTCSGTDNPITFQPNFIPEPASIEWSFGDFSFSNELWPVHVYEHGGEYEVSVNVNYPNGRVEHTSRVITVNESPHPDLGPDILTCEDEEVTLNAGNEPGLYAWSDGSTFGQNIFELTVSDTGIFWVRITNTEGCSTTDSIHVGWFNKAVFNEDNLIITPTSCGGSNGSIEGIQIEGVQYSGFEWYNAADSLISTNIDINGLPVGNYYLHVLDDNGCTTISDSYTITDGGDIQITSLDFSSSYCMQNNGNIIITAISGGNNDFSYSIDDGENWQTDSIFEDLIPGEYIIRVKDQNDCETVYGDNPVVIENIEGPQLVDVFVTHENDNNSDGSIYLEAIVSSGDIMYSIVSGNIFQSGGLFEGLSAGNYYCVVRDEFGCDTTFVIEINRIYSQIIDAIAGDDNTCIGDAAASPLFLNSFNDVSGFHVMLTYDNTIMICDAYMNIHPDLADNIQVSINTAGEIHITWQGQSKVSLPDNTVMTELVFRAIDAGLSHVDWIAEQGESQFFNEDGEQINTNYQVGNVQIYTRPNIFLTPQTEVCEDDMIMVSPFVDGGTGAYTSLWEGPDNFTSDSELLLLGDAKKSMDGIYTLTVTDTINCIESKSVDITIFESPLIVFSEYDTLWVEPGYILEAGDNSNIYQWNTGETTPEIVIDTIGNYIVEVISTEGCKSTDTVQILWGGHPFYLPNAFTPDGDGLNDTFGAIPKYDYVKRYHLSIFNRWGQLVFETTDINNGWDGTYQGKPCMKGAYLYRIDYEEFGQQAMDSKLVEGTAMLIR